MQITTKLFSVLLVGLLSISGQSKAMEAQRVVFSPARRVQFNEPAAPASAVKAHRRSQTAAGALESARSAIVSEEPAQAAEPSMLQYLLDPKKLVKDTASKTAETIAFGRPGGIISVAEAAPVVGAWYFAEPLSKALNGLSSGISYLWNMGSEPVVTRSAHLLENAADETVAQPVKRTIRRVSPAAIKTVAVFAGAGIALHNYSKSEKGQAIIEAVKRSGLETRQAVAQEGQQRRLE
ncbi:MAG TPA: hypothetical protein VFF04_05140, partial [Candidatus Babeliales bacterium]|nr:hypothetical protein [Candidatus Babeliales bacterium]